MKLALKTTLIAVSVAFLFAGCGGSSSPSAPYEGITITPDSTVDGVNYYTHVVKFDGVTPYTLQFSTLNGVWNMRFTSNDTWQVIANRLLLYTSPNFSFVQAEAYIEEMGFEEVDFDDNVSPATFTVILEGSAGAALSANTPLLQIIEGYLLRSDIFAGAAPIAL